MSMAGWCDTGGGSWDATPLLFCPVVGVASGCPVPYLEWTCGVTKVWRGRGCDSGVECVPHGGEGHQ